SVRAARRRGADVLPRPRRQLPGDRLAGRHDTRPLRVRRRPEEARRRVPSGRREPAREALPASRRRGLTAALLHVTNGDVVAERLRAAGFADVLPWREVLHEGPVPAGSDLHETRARFLASCGWAS